MLDYYSLMYNCLTQNYFSIILSEKLLKNFLAEKLVNCDECVSKFSEAGGCGCMINQPCDVSNLIPDGCYTCEDKAIKYCNSRLSMFWWHQMISILITKTIFEYTIVSHLIIYEIR